MVARIPALACLLTLTALPLTGCGFQPMYGSYAAAPEADLGQIAIDVIPDSSGVILRNALIDRFYKDGYPSAPRYRLSVDKISETETELDVTTESESTRSQLRQATVVKLYDRQSISPGTPVLSRPLSSLASFNILESEFATRVSEQDARERSLKDLARQIELTATLYFNRNN